MERLRKIATKPYAHDHLFHTLLGLFEVETAVYDPQMDIAHDTP